MVTFSNSPVLISVRHRVQWRTAVLCLILSKFHSQRARLDHLQLLNWSLETDGTRELLKVWLSGCSTDGPGNGPHRPRAEHHDHFGARPEPGGCVVLEKGRADGNRQSLSRRSLMPETMC